MTAQAQVTVYWDINSTTAGAGGITPSGNWNTTGATNWNTASDGTGATANWNNSGANNAVFAAGTDATGNYSVTLTGGISAGDLTTEEGNVTLAGNTLTIIGAGGSTITTATGTSLTINSILAGSVALNKAGTGTLVLSGANTNTGAITVAAGVLNIQNGSALGTTASGTTVANFATLQLQGGITVGAEPLTLSGLGVGSNGALQNLSGNNTYQGAITVGFNATIGSTAGTLTLDSTATILTGAASKNINFRPTNGAIVANGVISGDGNLIQSGISGTTTLTAANTYTGTTSVSAGTLLLTNGDALGSTAAGTTVNSGATLALQGGIAVGAETLSLAGTGVSSTGALRNVSGNNTYGGNITRTAAATIHADAGTLTLTGTQSGDFNATFDAASGATINATSTSVISGAANVTKSGAGTLVLNATNTYTGSTNITGGTLQLGASNVLPDGTAVSVSSGATFDVNGKTDTIGSLAGAGATTLGAGALTAGADNTSTTYSGVMSGTGSFTKAGTGTMTLSGATANSYSGGTTVNDGTLALNKTGVAAVGTGPLVIGDGVGTANSANVTVQASNQLGSGINVTLASDGRLNVGAQTDSIKNVVGSGTLANAAGGSITMDKLGAAIAGGNASGAFTGTLAINGTLNFNGGIISNSNSAAGTGTLSLATNSSLTLQGTNSFGGTLALHDGDTLNLSGANINFDTLTITGNTVLDFGTSGGSTLNLNTLKFLDPSATLTILNWDYGSDFLYANNFSGGSGGVTPGTYDDPGKGLAPQNQITFTGFTNSDTKWQLSDNQILPVPEPSTYGAIFIGLALSFTGWRRWRAKQRA